MDQKNTTTSAAGSSPAREDFVSLCMAGATRPEQWRSWLEDARKSGLSGADHELLGISSQEFSDLQGNARSMEFYVLKRRHGGRGCSRLWPGCYVRYAFEHDPGMPVLETGWVDVVDNRNALCRIQCDDQFAGMRAVTIRIPDIVDVLPFKERPLVYYKSMVCGSCAECDHSGNSEPPESCPNRDLLMAVLEKQRTDSEYIRKYVLGGIAAPGGCPSGCHGCSGSGHGGPSQA